MDYVQHPLTMPSQILLALLKADVAHLDQQMREINRLRAQLGRQWPHPSSRRARRGSVRQDAAEHAR